MPSHLIAVMAMLVSSNCVMILSLHKEFNDLLVEVLSVTVGGCLGFLCLVYLAVHFTILGRATTNHAKMIRSWKILPDINSYERRVFQSFPVAKIQMGNCYTVNRMSGLAITLKAINYTGKALLTVIKHK
jgi:hypothetical protein